MFPGGSAPPRSKSSCSSRLKRCLIRALRRLRRSSRDARHDRCCHRQHAYFRKACRYGCRGRRSADKGACPARLCGRSRSRAEPTQAASKPVSLLFTSAGKVTPLYKALSTDFHRSIDFYAARDTKVGEEAMKSFGVDKTPALLVLHGDEVSKYDGVCGPRSFSQARADDSSERRSAQVRFAAQVPCQLCGAEARSHGQEGARRFVAGSVGGGLGTQTEHCIAGSVSRSAPTLQNDLTPTSPP